MIATSVVKSIMPMRGMIRRSGSSIGSVIEFSACMIGLEGSRTNQRKDRLVIRRKKSARYHFQNVVRAVAQGQTAHGNLVPDR